MRLDRDVLEAAVEEQAAVPAAGPGRSARACTIVRVRAASSASITVEGGLDCAHEDVAECPHFRRRIAGRVGA
ncbi:hypothetical protein [Streptomyces smaragdinus]|uniref:hypothetical protein n=1 Tax=Streptomyces smaragdinus TaxID=2585196 RepID=UPI002B212AB1|nr:hypothetical protein [Streptomyces smaragdinus]